MNKSELQQKALSNVLNSDSLVNYSMIFAGFEAKGIRTAEILPRENVFTFNAWQAKGRRVNKGEHGIKIVTFVPMTKKDKDTGEEVSFRRPRKVAVFHVSQTSVI